MAKKEKKLKVDKKTKKIEVVAKTESKANQNILTSF